MASEHEKRRGDKGPAGGGGLQVPKPSQAEGERPAGEEQRPELENKIKGTPGKPSQAEGER